MKGAMYFGCLILALFSCRKNNINEYPEELNCEKYAGEYLMLDVENDTSYIMIIDCIPLKEGSVDYLDTVFYSNFANKFSFGHRIYSDGNINGTNIQPILDKSQHKWNFSNVYGADYQNKINVLIGDSIYLYFSIDNTAYWIEEGVPYQSITSVHSGVKIH